MADRRRFVGVRLSPNGYDYLTWVAHRDRVTVSEAHRRLLAVGAQRDLEQHGPPDPQWAAQRSAGAGVEARDERPDEHEHRDSDGDRRSSEVPRVPDGGLNLGDAIGNLVHAGFRPEAVPDDAA